MWLYCILRVLRLPQAGLFFLLHLPSAVNCLRVVRAPFGSLPRRLELGKNERIAQNTVKSAEAEPPKTRFLLPQEEHLSQHPDVVNCCPVPSIPSHPLPWKPSHLSLLPPSPSWERDNLFPGKAAVIICLSLKHVPVLLNSATCSVLHSMEATSLTETCLAGTGERVLLAKGGTLLRCCPKVCQSKECGSCLQNEEITER